MRHFANGLLGHISAIGKDKPRKRDVIVVTVVSYICSFDYMTSKSPA